jgi:hypothetical protein
MGGACNTHCKYEKRVQIFVGNPEEEDQSEDIGVNRRIILEWILRK